MATWRLSALGALLTVFAQEHADYIGVRFKDLSRLGTTVIEKQSSAEGVVAGSVFEDYLAEMAKRHAAIVPAGRPTFGAHRPYPGYTEVKVEDIFKGELYRYCAVWSSRNVVAGATAHPSFVMSCSSTKQVIAESSSKHGEIENSSLIELIRSVRALCALRRTCVDWHCQSMMD